MQHFQRAALEFGRTIHVVLHDVNVAASYVDRIVTLKGGTVAYSGTPEQIMRNEALSDVFGTPLMVIEGSTEPLACPC